MNIKSTEEFNLSSTVLSQNWFQQIWGSYTVEGTEYFTNIKAIQPIDKEKDLKGNDEEISNKLYVNSNDVADLKEYCNSKDNEDKTVYLMRYQVSDYIAQEASLVKVSGRRIDTNAYFFQQTVNLDFDIIDVTFTKKNIDTVVPVVMTPIDIIHDSSPPLITISDKAADNFFRIILTIILLIIIFVVCYPILPIIVKGISWFITKIIQGIIACVKWIKDFFTNLFKKE